MRQKEDEGMAPIQSLANMSQDMVPREVDRLFPAEFERNRDSVKEGKMQLKFTLPEQFGQKFLEKDDIDYIYEKGQEQEMFQFDAWYAALFDHSDPAQLELSRRINPSWFERRMKAVDKSLEMQRKIAKIKLFGIQDKEDVMTTYAISTGRINPSLYMTNFMDPPQPHPAVLNQQYQQGTFAPRSYDHYLIPVPQPAGPANPLDYTGAAAHIGVGTDQYQLTQMMRGAVNTPAPGFPAMMSMGTGNAAFPIAQNQSQLWTQGLSTGNGEARRQRYYYSGGDGFPIYQEGDYKRNFTLDAAEQARRATARANALRAQAQAAAANQGGQAGPPAGNP